MARYKMVFSALLCFGSALGAASFVTAEDSEQQARPAQPQRADPARTASMTQIDPPSLQIQLNEAATRSRIQANISGISVNDVLAAAAQIERAPRDAEARERWEEKNAGDQSVSRAQIVALSRLKPIEGRVASPENVVPPIRALCRRMAVLWLCLATACRIFIQNNMPNSQHKCEKQAPWCQNICRMKRRGLCFFH